MVFRFRERLAHPFVILIIGFPAFYGVLLLSSWGGRTRRLGTDHVQLEAQPKERGGLPFGEEDEAPFVGLLRVEKFA